MAAAAAALLLLPCVASMLAGAGTAADVVGIIDWAPTFVGQHNAARADVGVAPLAWDDTVAAYATRYAGERKGDCKLKHSGGPYGENLFWGSAGANWTATDAVAIWVSEKQDYDCGNNSCAPGKVCGHYTQVVWENTTKVGCAAATCDGGGGTFIVCEYDLPGNVVGVPPYSGCGLFNRSAQGSPQVFLNLQNAARADVGVAPLAWDDTAAAYATRYAAKRKGDCQLEHSGGPYGENLFWGRAGANWTATDAFAACVSEKQDYDCGSNSCAPGKVCGNYTQVVWENTTKVGCAAATCNVGGGTFIVCEYDPGNVVGVPPYSRCGLFSRSVKGNGTNPKENGNSSSGNVSSPSREGSSPAILPIVLPVVTALCLISAILICIRRKRSSLKKAVPYTACSEDIEDIKSELLDPSVIRVATGNFAEENKLGEGGFGQVYKGLMPDGQEVAVKRLAKGSKQGLRELKNELLLVTKLQHRNLVSLIGACLDGEDKLLVYEYVPNKSLDTFIFGSEISTSFFYSKQSLNSTTIS